MTMNRTETVVPPAFEGWAIVEIMGHRRHYGMVREVEAFGGKMCRVDVPEAPAVERERQEYPHHGGGTVTTVREIIPAVPAKTFLYGASAIFGIAPCTEEVVRKALEREQVDAWIPVARAALAAAPGEDDDGIIDADYGDGEPG